MVKVGLQITEGLYQWSMLCKMYTIADCHYIFSCQAKGGGLAFLQVNQSSLKENSSSGRPSALLAYINRDHEYVVFDPLTQEQQELNVHRKKGAADFEEAGMT